ncbi:peptide deformylase [Candidatus Daviesbacteria bacterium]|nr:peptide deformylase [Candidatus Daviesbacteria bacterium]
MQFLKPNDPRLREIAQKADPNSEDTQKIIKAMLKIAHGEQKGKKKPIMVGLATPQIGISKRIILVDVKADGKGKVGDPRIYINPEITWQSKRKGEWYEGCYSTGKICGIVSRPVSIRLQAFTMTPQGWKPKVERWTGYTARIFQHEIDHLNGKVFISHITNPDHLHIVEEKEFPLYRNKEAWRNWPKKAPLPLAIGNLKKV